MLPSMSEILICLKYVKTYFMCTHVLHGSEICNDICQNLSPHIIKYIFRYTCCICIWFRCALRVWAYNGSQSQPTHRTNQGSLGHAGLRKCHSQRVSGDATDLSDQKPHCGCLLHARRSAPRSPCPDPRFTVGPYHLIPAHRRVGSADLLRSKPQAG